MNSDIQDPTQSTNDADDILESTQSAPQTFFELVRVRIAGKEPLVILLSILTVITLVIFGITILNAGQAKNKANSPAEISPTGTRTTPTKSITEKPTKTATPTLKNQQKSTLNPTVSATISPTSAKAPPTITLTSTPQPTPTTVDTQPPTTNITYPQTNGEITYKIDSKVCVIMSAPTDNVSSASEIVTHFAFDSDGYSQVSGTGYLCRYELLNGSHTLRYKSQDRAGNMEAERTLSFAVNIPDNTLPTPTSTITPTVEPPTPTQE
ncbi:MAG TPA: hypothetical protein PKG71_03325 [Candidatus Woesebacteria bacterium]|nr:hypothetical protein [Candidatus Woesebacteria bacterium]HNS94973.1 hypothetical protein [Candidatus Woesebacteria bacterium]